MTVRICFISGSLARQSMELNPSSSLAVGRSRTCMMRASEPDVSARHIEFRRGANGGVTVEVLSTRKTYFNGTPVVLSDVFPVKNGDTLKCGELLACKVEMDEEAGLARSVDGDATVAPSGPVCGDGSIDADKTLPPPLKSSVPSAVKSDSSLTVLKEASPDSNSTIAIQTRAASDEELDDIRRELRARRIRQVVCVIGFALLFFAAALGMWMWFRPKTEEFVSWPENDNGLSMERHVLVAPYLALNLPDSVGCNPEKKEGDVEVWTFIGIRHDVPMHFQAISVSSTNELTIGRDRSFDRWLRNRRDADASFNPSNDRRRFWLGKGSGNGILVNYVAYTRRIELEDYYGYLMFFRYEDTVHAIFAEVLLRDRWRCEPFMRRYHEEFIIFAPKRLPYAWEGHDTLRPGDCPKCDLDEAERYFSPDGKLAAAYWDSVWYRIRSALVKAKIQGNEKMLERAKIMLVAMRSAQSKWYADQRNAWNQADRACDERAKRAVQALAESAFSDDFRNYDYRYDRIKRKDWKK